MCIRDRGIGFVCRKQKPDNIRFVGIECEQMCIRDSFQNPYCLSHALLRLLVDDRNFQSLHAQIGLERLVDLFEREPVGDQVVHRQTDALGAFEEIEGRRVVAQGIDPVSYTHLDVYKRQVYTDPLLFGDPIDRHAGKGFRCVQDLSLIHI